MFARITTLTLALGLGLLMAPGALEAAPPASAVCTIELPDGSCTNPGCLVVGAYNTVRYTAGLEDKTPSLDCTM